MKNLAPDLAADGKKHYKSEWWNHISFQNIGHVKSTDV